MKAFLEEYGFVILIAIVIILLIVMATPVGNSIKASILGLVDRFSGTATSKLDKADQGDFTVNLRQAASTGALMYMDINSDSTTDRYTLTMTYVSGGKTHTTAMYASSETPSTEGAVNKGILTAKVGGAAASSTIENKTYAILSTGLGCTSHTSEPGLAIDDGAEVVGCHLIVIARKCDSYGEVHVLP